LADHQSEIACQGSQFEGSMIRSQKQNILSVIGQKAFGLIKRSRDSLSILSAEKSLIRAKNLRVNLSMREQAVDVYYQIDDDFEGALSFQFPFPIECNPVMMSIIGLWESIFLAQLCFAEEVELQFPVVPSMIEDLKPVIQNLYDVRCHREQFPFVDLPDFRTSSPLDIPVSHKLSENNKKACPLWSGGADSTLSLLLLKENDFEVIPIHFGVNYDVARFEKLAVDEINKQLDLPIQYIDVNFPNFFPIVTQYSNCIASPPFHNSIPHGRELMLIAPSLLVANHYGATNICLAHESEVWTAKVTYRDKVFSKNDTQSEEMTLILDNFLSKYLNLPIKLFSPVAALSDFRKFKILLTKYPDVLRNISFCYWDQHCGECPKCIRYYLYQRALGKTVIFFQHDPVKEESPYLKMIIEFWQYRWQSYWIDINYALYNIVNNEKDLEPLLQTYKDKVYPEIAGEIITIQKKALDTSPVQLLPVSWKSDFVEEK
jgi:7-cyano-7-deazaguanine synthase in queuosine biosynthesis